ncbi:hypothetical protein [Niveibacterium terrae]|uniref:hypothetical protein n=1 Tax=Niveibacterium terrae TaxID=3373598 RepID=UPI003A8C92CE
MTIKPLQTENLLHLWEQGKRRHPVDRALLLHACAMPGADPDTLADETLGRRNRALLALRAATFGPRMPAYLDCPCCAERLELTLDVVELQALAPTQAHPVEVDGLRFRLPTSRDLASVAAEAESETAALRLFEACLLPGSPQPSPEALPPLIERVGEALDQADPLAALSLDSQCAACGHAWEAAFDIASFLWDEIESRAHRLLDDVHSLASAYGWSESAILALSDARREAYLERISP